MSVSWRISEGLVLLESDEQSALAEWQAAVTLALITGSARYGMGRLAEGLLDRDRSAEFRIFLDLAEAEAWLREGPAAS